MNDWANEFLRYFTFSLAKGLGAIFERASYLYWPYLLSSVVIAAIAWRWFVTSSGKRGWDDFFDQYFSRQVWWHRSAQADYWLYLVNIVVLPVLFALLLLDERQIASGLGDLIGLSAGVGEVSAGMRIVFTVLFFIAYDFGRFVAHCFLHDVPILWEFHKVHHSAEVLTPMTSFRAHPLELLLMAWGPVVTTGVLTLAFNVLSNQISFYSFLGVHAVLFASNLIGNLRHSPVWLSYGPRWGEWFISPAHHQLHHSCEPRHLGCNRGFELAVWDRLYGTLYVPGTQPEKLKLGLGDETENRYYSVARMYWLPFVGAAGQVGAVRRRLIAKLGFR
jgi:sterol desaturase/sphingolipid hydroxylase (fatty acid hydroxylase superfamily)